MDHEQVALSSRTHWYEGLTAMHWRVLKASFLGWIFDGYEAFALIVALPPALHSLLTPEQAPNAAIYVGLAIGITLLGWGIGLAAHGFSVYGLGGFLGAEWEERKIQEIISKRRPQ